MNTQKARPLKRRATATRLAFGDCCTLGSSDPRFLPLRLALRGPFLDAPNLVHAALVAPSGEGRGEPQCDNLARGFRGDQLGAQRQHIRVIVLAAVARCRAIIA